MMTDYNDGKWHGWNGGDRPVHPKTLVEYVTDSGKQETVEAGDLLWFDTVSPIRAFRVVKEHKEPREFWVAPNRFMREGFELVPRNYPNAIHVREVLE